MQFFLFGVLVSGEIFIPLFRQISFDILLLLAVRDSIFHIPRKEVATLSPNYQVVTFLLCIPPPFISLHNLMPEYI